VAAGEPEMQSALAQDSEQLAAMAAAPFLFVQDRLRWLSYGGGLRVRSVCRADGACIQAVSAEPSAACLLSREEDEGERHVGVRLESVDGMSFLGQDGLEDLPGSAIGLDVKGLSGALKNLLAGGEIWAGHIRVERSATIKRGKYRAETRALNTCLDIGSFAHAALTLIRKDVVLVGGSQQVAIRLIIKVQPTRRLSPLPHNGDTI
jgi:hypothetical protein